MTAISSAENKQYKKAKSLALKKYRDREGLFVAEGPNLVEEALEANMADTVFLREGYSGWLPREEVSTRVLTLAPGLFDKLSDTENSRGILATVVKPEYSKEHVLGKDKRVIVLDRLQDPGNIGTVIRTAEAAGLDGVAWVKGTGDPFSPKAVRAAAGSVLRIPMVCTGDPEETLDLLKDAGKTIILSHVKGEETDSLPKDDTAIIIGNEGNGPDDCFIQGAHMTVKIPMSGKVESLNAAVAAAILMYKQDERR